METRWYPEGIYSPEIIKDKKYAIIVLNRKIKIKPEIARGLWQNAEIRMTVDGGTDRWLSFVRTHFNGETLKLPDIISGDFDSIKKETLNCFQNIKQIHTPNQDETDFTKALKVLKPTVEEKQIEIILVIHDVSGRLDQFMANINTLYKSNQLYKDNIKIYLISNNSLTWLLNPGSNSIQIPLDLFKSKRWCSLIPIGEKTIVRTKGLKWNLNNHVLQFGGLVSTSNTYSTQLVIVETNNFLLWSMGVFDCVNDD